MLKDPTEFRKRFQAWKMGAQVYDKGKPIQAESPTFNYIDRATRYIADHEGFVDHVYEDTVASQDYAKKHGYWSDKYKKYVLPTAGYGWTAKNDLHNWTKEEANKRLREDVVKYDNNGRRLIPGWDNMPDERKMAVIDLFHQGGMGVLNKMPKFYAALKAGDENAGRHISFASTQTPRRNNDRVALWNNPQEKVIKAIDAKIAVNRILKNLSLEELNPWSSVPQVEDIMAGQVFNRMLTMPQIIGQ